MGADADALEHAGARWVRMRSGAGCAGELELDADGLGADELERWSTLKAGWPPNHCAWPPPRRAAASPMWPWPAPPRPPPPHPSHMLPPCPWQCQCHISRPGSRGWRPGTQQVASGGSSTLQCGTKPTGAANHRPLCRLAGCCGAAVGATAPAATAPTAAAAAPRWGCRRSR